MANAFIAEQKLVHGMSTKKKMNQTEKELYI